MEKSTSVRIDRLTHEFTGVKRVVQDSIDEIKLRLEHQGIPGITKSPDTVSSGSADHLIARRLNDLETRVGNNEATSNRQCEAQRDVIAEVRGEMTEMKNKLGSLRESSRSQARSRSSSAEPGAWKESVAGLRRNIEEVSNLSSKTREDAKRATEQQERSSAEIERLRMEMTEIRENAALQAAAHADERKSYATLFADQKRETERLNVRIEALVGLLEESRKSAATTEMLQKEAQKDLSNLGTRVSENRDDINVLKARVAMAPSGVIGGGQMTGGLPPGRLGSETSKGQRAAPGLAEDNASNLGYTPAPSHFGATGYHQQDNARGRDENSEVPGSGGPFSAAMRAGQPERCDVCGVMHVPADLNRCPECRGNFWARCSPGAGACPNCDGPAFRRGRDDQRAPIGQRPGRMGVSRDQGQARGECNPDVDC